MSCLDDDLAEKDLFEDLEDEYDGDFCEFGFDDDEDEHVSLEGSESQLSCACDHGDTSCVHDSRDDMEPHHACRCHDIPVRSLETP